MYVYICMYMYICIYTYMCIYIYIYTDTVHTYVYTLVCSMYYIFVGLLGKGGANAWTLTAHAVRANYSKVGR